MEREKTLEEYLVKRIKKSGYPLEIEISNLLDKAGYVVFNTQYYFDEEIKQGRDIDIYAIPLECHPSEEKLDPFIVRTELAIECKKSETHAWIFYTRPRIPMSSIYVTGQYHTSVPKPEEFSTEWFQWFFEQNILILHYDKFKRIAIAYDEVKKKKIEKENRQKKTKKDNSSRREIFEAINQLRKFTCYEIHKTFGRISKLSETSSSREYIVIIFPILVFDGDMFEVDFDSGEPKLKRKNHILLETHYRCPYLQEVKSFTIDIVHRSYFVEFMKALKLSFYELRETIIQNHDELIKKTKETKIECVKESARFSVKGIK